MIRFGTESGSVYEVDDSEDDWRVRRSTFAHDLRGDGEWIDLLERPTIEAGYSVVFVLEILSPAQFEGAECTMRRTSPVTWTEVGA